jgi:hypothetical protein
MFPGANVKRVFLGLHAVDFRKGHDGLLAEAYKLGLDVLSGDSILFLSKDRRKLKVLFSDDQGMWLWCKKLHRGHNKYNFKFLTDPHCKEISQGEMGLIFEGASFTVHKKIKAWK